MKNPIKHYTSKQRRRKIQRLARDSNNLRTQMKEIGILPEERISYVKRLYGPLSSVDNYFVFAGTLIDLHTKKAILKQNIPKAYIRQKLSETLQPEPSLKENILEGRGSY